MSNELIQKAAEALDIALGRTGVFSPPELDFMCAAYDGLVAALQTSLPQPDDFKGWYCAHCERGVDASEATFNEQHQECGRVITDDRPPKPSLLQDVEEWIYDHRIELGSMESGKIVMTVVRVSDLRAFLAGKGLMPVILDRDDARLALWKAIGNIKIGNKTDDKLILQELHALGFGICKLPHVTASKGE